MSTNRKWAQKGDEPKDTQLVRSKTRVPPKAVCLGDPLLSDTESHNNCNGKFQILLYMYFIYVVFNSVNNI